MKQYDLTNLSLSALLRLLNGSLPAGAAPLSEKQLRRLYQQAGEKISGKTPGRINMLKYAAWLLGERRRRASIAPKQSRTYEEMKEAARARSTEASLSGRDIGPLPEVVDPERRARCRASLREFCETYFPETFYLKWSPDHLEVLSKIETAVRDGGLFALAMPRGEGKTSICERSVLWAGLNGFRKFITIVGATETAAVELMETVKAELETNDLLLEDYPEVCHPIRRLEGINNRASGQLLEGKRTHISWCGNEIVLPTVDGSAASGIIILAVGITGRIRGMKRKVDGKDVRPELVIIDDPQTRESAESSEQCAKRLRAIKGDILGLAGPGKTISGVMPCTVISPDDVADQILNRKKNPEWNGYRLPLMRHMPDKKAMELWHRYREISIDSYLKYNDNRDATEFYRMHRAAMDSGAEPSWLERYNADEISAVQYAMNLYFKGEEAFMAEYQNDPTPQETADVEKLTVEQIFARQNHRERFTVPVQAQSLTMFIDVQKDLLYYTVCAVSETFSTWVIDYGTFPDQKRRYFTLKDAKASFRNLYPEATSEGAIYEAIRELTDDFLSRDFLRDDGAKLRITKCAVDSGWGFSTDSVYLACRQSPYAAILYPSKGVGIGAAQKPFSEYRKVPGEKIGDNWRITGARGKRFSRLLEYDTNFWKSFYRERLLASPGDTGSFTIWGNNNEQHRMFAEHLTAETSVPTSGRGRKVDVWKMIPNRENHFLDGIVGCLVLASVDGCKIVEKKPFSRTVSVPRPAPPPNRTEKKVHKLGRIHELH